MVSRAILNGWPIVPPSRRQNAPVNLVAPSISGTFTVGQTLTISDGIWDGFPVITYSRVWFRNGQLINGAIGSTYTLVDADAGVIISAAVVASNAFGSSSKDIAGSLSAGGGDPIPPYPAPPGFVWQAETYQGQQTYYLDQPVLFLARAA